MYLVYNVIEYSCAQQPSQWAVAKVESYYIKLFLMNLNKVNFLMKTIGNLTKIDYK